eukprot:3869789-Amphidinium_carterae.1
MVSGLASGLASMKEQDHEDNVNYITERLNDEDKDLAGIIVRLMKDGTLRKALSGDSSSDREARLGKELPAGCDSIRGLRETFLWKCLGDFEPSIFNSETYESLSDSNCNKQFFLNVFTFGLGAKQSTKLPT